MRFRTWFLSLGCFLALAGLSGCGNTRTASTTDSDSLVALSPEEKGDANLTPSSQYPSGGTSSQTTPRRSTPRSTGTVSSGPRVPSGTPIAVRVNSEVSSKTASVGQSWSGVVAEDVVVDGRTLIPAGSTVHGTVSAARAAEHGDRAMIDLALTSVEVNGRSYRVHGGTEAIVAGSTRARNLGAIAGSAAAGAIIGKTVGGKHGTLIGGLIGAGAATGAVAKSKGYQVVLKPGTELTFTTTESFAVRR